MRRFRIAVPWALAAALAACCPCRHLTTSTGTRDSVRVETLVRTEYVPDTVFVEVPVESERQTVRDTVSHLETSFAVSDAAITPDGSLSHSLANKPQKRPAAVEKEVVYRDSIVYRDRAVEAVKTVEVERELTWWQRTQMRGFWVLLAALAVAYRKKIIAIVKRIA